MSADLLARLIEAGTPATLVAEVAMAIAQADAASAAIEGRRAADRGRQSRRRHAMSRDITLGSVTSRDVTDEPAPSPLPSPDPNQPHTPTRDHSPASARGAFPKPDWASVELWRDFLANRKRKGLANTATAHRKLLADIDRIADDEWPPGRILEAATGKGWGAIYPSIKDCDDGQRPHHDRPRRIAGNPRTTEMADAYRDLGFGG